MVDLSIVNLKLLSCSVLFVLHQFSSSAFELCARETIFTTRPHASAKLQRNSMKNRQRDPQATTRQGCNTEHSPETPRLPRVVVQLTNAVAVPSASQVAGRIVCIMCYVLRVMCYVYHLAENDYMQNSLINSKTIVPHRITYR